MSSYNDLLPIATEAVRRATDAMRHGSPGSLTFKGDRDVASELDFAIEHDARVFLATETPEIGFLGEEYGMSGPTELQWILDPIDGTANFVRALPLCGVSLALAYKRHPVLGIIHLPFLHSLYAAVEGGGAYANGKHLKVSSTNAIRDAIVAIGDYATEPDADAKNRLRLALTAQLASKAYRIRMTGSAALDLAWLAQGRLDAALTLSNHPWDVAAGTLIAREAGAEVVDGDGTSHGWHSKFTLAVSPALTGDILALYLKANETVNPPKRGSQVGCS
ncbi:inositol monophosphatase family protein [Micromonospora robiginosa]|uniref:inositol-phosphate phosphatase n=1 Tax=Micromonospora robiginosa TaxID=2749844 RepID=A0A7L6BC82_9ACTN|nr:inositol monophosphatase family protein [Micromonospora ferruginea]QLQ39498.1 inositol monophosphatase family protein [Micromonospora ferruginea]